MNDEELELARAEAMKADRCFSKGRLRDEFRMKPKPGVEPVSFYKNGYGGQFGVYRIADCQPMRRRGCSPASQKQIRAQSILSVKARMRSNPQRPLSWHKGGSLWNLWFSIPRRPDLVKETSDRAGCY